MDRIAADGEHRELGRSGVDGEAARVAVSSGSERTNEPEGL